ncbi:Tfp pilus assembly protein FimT/FimU [Thermodesulfobacteriota bacterium]
MDGRINLAKQTGSFTPLLSPGCKFNVKSTEVLMPLPAPEKRTNSTHSLRGWYLTPNFRFPASRFSDGYTLIELIVVIALISIVLFISIPRFQGAVLADPTNAVSRWIIGTVASLKEGAVHHQKHYVLHVAMDTGKLWVSDESMSEEELENAENSGLELPDDVKVLDVEFPGKGKVAFGRADISFYRQGYSDRAFIHIEDDSYNQRSFLIETFLPKVRLYEEYVAFEE